MSSVWWCHVNIHLCMITLCSYFSHKFFFFHWFSVMSHNSRINQADSEVITKYFLCEWATKEVFKEKCCCFLFSMKKHFCQSYQQTLANRVIYFIFWYIDYIPKWEDFPFLKHRLSFVVCCNNFARRVWWTHHLLAVNFWANNRFS